MKIKFFNLLDKFDYLMKTGRTIGPICLIRWLLGWIIGYLFRCERVLD